MPFKHWLHIQGNLGETHGSLSFVETGYEHLKLSVVGAKSFHYSSYFFNDRYHCADFITAYSSKKKNNKKKPINEWRTIPVSGALGLSLQFFGEKKNKAKPKKKKKFGLPLKGYALCS